MNQYGATGGVDTDTPMFRQTAERYQQKMSTLLLECLYKQMESQSDMCDVTLVIGGVERKAHWCVLAVCPYFESVYRSDMKEKMAGKITLDFGDPSAIQAAIRFLHTGTVEITDKNIREILEASDFFQIEHLKELCMEFLQCVRITVKNCVGLCILGNLHNLEYAYNRALTFMNGHLAEVLEEDEALTLTADSVVDMITNVNLRYVSEEQFFGFLVRWVKCDSLKREEHFCDIFSHLNLSRVTNRFLTSEIERHTFVKNCVKCQTRLTDHREKLRTGEICQETEEKEVILVLGGNRRDTRYGTRCVDSVYAYIITENRWVQLPPLPTNIATHSLSASDGTQALYVMGSFRRLDHENVIYKFVSGAREWSVLHVELPTSFRDHCVEQISCVGGKVFAMIRVKSNEGGGMYECNRHIMELNEIDLNFEEKCIIFTQGMDDLIQCCTAMGRYICAICRVRQSNFMSSTHKLAKFVYYDAENDTLFDSSKVTYFPLDALYKRGNKLVSFFPQYVMYARRNEIVVARPGSTFARTFNLNSPMWRKFDWPLTKEEAERTDYCYCYHGGQFYMFGGRNSTSKFPVNSVIKFNFDKQRCDGIENLPETLMNSACCVMTLPTDLLRCHLGCPHCEILGRRPPAQDAGYSFPLRHDEDEDEY